MPLSSAQIAALSQLLDAALELPPDRQEAWLTGLPAEQQGLVPTLRQMLALASLTSGGLLLSSLPRLPSLADEPPEAQPGERVGPYRLMREIGRGGMGSVWLAERADGIFNRAVALKLPRLARHARLAERMAHERQIGALLEHPHIARLYDAGIDDTGRPYLVMEWVQGTSLLDHAARHHLNLAQRLQLMLQVCAAVAHAHRHLVVHRDLKPSNLLVGDDGQVKLLDFGIAQLLDADIGDGAAVDTERQRMHTPLYSAPEQRRGEAVSTAGDIFSLGVVLHELLTGQLPAPTSSAPVAALAGLSIDLQAVLRRAMQDDPAQRYSSVERLADDLQNVLAQRPVAAEPASLRHRAWLFGTRHRSALGAGAVALVVLASGTLVLLRQQALEQAQAQRAALSREFLFDLLGDAEPQAGQTAAQITGPQMVQSALARARSAFDAQPALRGQVLTQLAVMLRRFDQPDDALQLLREAIDLLAQSAAADAAALPIAQAQLAISLNDRDELGANVEAAALAQRALAGCSAASARCAKARAYAHNVLMHLANQRGDRSSALAHAEQEVAATEQAHGPGHAELAMALMQLAIMRRNQGSLTDAAVALARADAIARRTPLRATDLRSLHLHQALLQIDLGQYAAAQQGLTQLLAEPDAMAADVSALQPASPAVLAASQPPSTSVQRRALPYRLLAQALVAQGLLDDALRAADAGLVIAQAAGNGWELAFGRQARARALSGLGRHADATRDIQATLDGLTRRGLPVSGIEQLRARRLAGEIALRAGQTALASAWLAPLPAAHRRTPAQGVLAPVDLAQTLDLLGTMARQRANLVAAQGLHAEASAMLAAQLPAEHPLRLRNQLLSALAAWLAVATSATPAEASGAAGPTHAALVQTAARYLQSLPAASAWRRLPEATATNAAAWQQLVI